MMLPVLQVTATRPRIVNPPLGGGGGGPAVTIAVAVPDSVPFDACTVLVNVAATLPAVKGAVRPVVPAGIVPPPLMTVQVTVPVIGTVLTGMVPGFGVTTMVASGPAVTMAVAVPKIVPLVARTVLVNVPVTAPAVKRPDAALMVPPPAVTDQTGVIATTLPFASLPTAVYCRLVLMGIVPGFGVTVIVASAPGVTMTVAVAVIPLQVTTTVLVNVPAVVPAVNRPVLEIVPPPATTDQVGWVPVMVVPRPSFVTTVNCCVPPVGRVAEAGVMVSDVIGLKSVLLEHAAINSAANAPATTIRAARAPEARDCKVRLLTAMFIELLLT
jgi:hypothetical protein